MKLTSITLALLLSIFLFTGTASADQPSTDQSPTIQSAQDTVNYLEDKTVVEPSMPAQSTPQFAQSCCKICKKGKACGNS